MMRENYKAVQSVMCLIVGALLMVTACAPSNGAGDADLKTVRFSMGWLPQGSMAGVIVAQENGYYRDVGLNVEATRGFGGIRTVNEVDQGMFEFGYGDPLGVILNRSNGGKTKMVGAINLTWPAGACFVKERHDVKAPRDLSGLTFGGGQSSPIQVLMPAWLQANGMEASELEVMQLDPSVIVATLIEGKIDAGECWKGNSLALFQKRARQAGVTLGWLPYGEYGPDIYGNGIVTSERLIESDPDTVRNFLSATYRGYKYARENPQEATAIMTLRYPVLDEAVTLQQVLEIGELMGDEEPDGLMDPNKIIETIEFLESAYDFEGFGEVDDLYSNAFLGRQEPEGSH